MPLAGVVAQAGVLDLREADRLGLGEGATARFMGGHAGEVPDAYADASPIERLPAGVPVLIVHGDADQRVPRREASAYADAARRPATRSTSSCVPATTTSSTSTRRAGRGRT